MQDAFQEAQLEDRKSTLLCLIQHSLQRAHFYRITKAECFQVTLMLSLWFWEIEAHTKKEKQVMKAIQKEAVVL